MKVTILSILLSSLFISACGSHSKYNNDQCIQNKVTGAFYKIRDIGPKSYILSPYTSDCARICPSQATTASFLSGFDKQCMSNVLTLEVLFNENDNLASIECPVECSAFIFGNITWEPKK